MKKPKWHWEDTSNRSDALGLETAISPMPELPETRAAICFKPEKREDEGDNSLMKRILQDHGPAEESVVDWERDYSRHSFVQHFQRWEGLVLAVYQDTFLARLTDSKGLRMPRVARIKKTLINKNDWEVFFQEGFEFEWVFKEVITNGTFSRKNEIRFTPITRYLPEEVDDFVKKSMSEFSYMLKKDD